MATIDTTTLGGLFKRLYAPWEIEQLVNLTYPSLAQLAPKGSAMLGGAQGPNATTAGGGFTFAVRGESAHGHAYISETQDLPPGRQSAIFQAFVNPTVHAGVVQLSGLSRATSSGDNMSFARAFDENVQATIESMSAYKEGVLFRDGSGQIGTLTSNPDGAAATQTFNDVGFLREGMVVDVVDTDLSTHHNDATKITAVDWVARSATFSPVLVVAAEIGDFLYMDGSQVAGTAATSKEPVGFEGSLLSTGTYLGLPRATTPNWSASQLAAGGFFDEEILLRARTRLTQETGIQLTSMASRLKVATHPTQVDVLFKLAIPRIRYQGGGGSFDLGNSDNLEFGGIKFVTSHAAPTDKAYLGDFRKSQQLYTSGGELHVDTEYNGSALKWVATKDVGLVFIKEYCAFAVKNPTAFVRITGLSQLSR